MSTLIGKMLIALFGFSLLAAVSAGHQLRHDLGRIQTEWLAIVETSATPEERAQALEELSAQVERIVDRHPSEQEARRWEAIIAGSYAEAVDAFVADYMGFQAFDTDGRKSGSLFNPLHAALPGLALLTCDNRLPAPVCRDSRSPVVITVARGANRS